MNDTHKFINFITEVEHVTDGWNSNTLTKKRDGTERQYIVETSFAVNKKNTDPEKMRTKKYLWIRNKKTSITREHYHRSNELTRKNHTKTSHNWMRRWKPLLSFNRKTQEIEYAADTVDHPEKNRRRTNVEKLFKTNRTVSKRKQ